MNDIVIREREHQTAARLAEKRFNVQVWHRRAGKSFFNICRMIARALISGVDDWQAGYLAPTRTQASQIASPYFLRFCEGFGAEYNKSEMCLRIPSVGLIRLYSGENYERMRGLYFDDVVIDEAAQVPSTALSEVISPAVADRLGGITIAGTPKGRRNMLYEQLQYAQTSGDPDWSASVLGWQDTGALDPKEVERMRRSMREEEFAQELECSFDGSLRGAYYGKDMDAAHASGRVTVVKYKIGLPVYCALDLGWSDAMVAIFFQRVGTETHILACETYHETSIPDMVMAWRKLPWPVDLVILPHDARVRELGTGKSRQQTFREAGLKTAICPSRSVHEGIEAVRQLLPHCWFDAERTVLLRDALSAYRSKYDEVLRVSSVTPIHDWSSHYADAMRYLAVGYPARTGQANGWGNRPKFQGTI
ncbi:MAG: terminase large subunit domain-containing protein [Mangrovicoccus sp.]